MKKITLALALLTMGAQAQIFPAPYCIIEENGASIEEITSVIFDGISMDNTDDSLLLIDKTSTVVNAVRGETYTLEVDGNTYGNFDNDIVAFIDWNQNDLLEDAGEIYEIGTLTNSSGYGSNSITFNITIPTDAILGNTRIRITKVYKDDYTSAVINPCEILMEIPGYGIYEGYGQALDFTLNIEEEALSIKTFETNALSVYPNPTQDVLNIKYKSALNTVKVYNLLGQEVLVQNTSASQLQLDVSSLTAGAYMVKLFADEGQHSFKIIKQ
ncbi:MAG: T9SS type A sorting domain-containing protein [Xanthomarina sp.]